MEYAFDLDKDYHEQFNEYANELAALCELEDRPKLDERIAIIGDLIETYIESTGERPPTARLSRLARAIDVDYCKDRNVYKTRDTENGYLTLSQLTYRKKREVGEHVSEAYDTEGVNTKAPTSGNYRKERELIGDDYMSRRLPSAYGYTRAYGKPIIYEHNEGR